MDNSELEGKWKDIRGKLKHNHEQLKDDDLQFTKGHEEELIGNLQNKLGKSRDEVMKLLHHYGNPNSR